MTMLTGEHLYTISYSLVGTQFTFHDSLTTDTIWGTREGSTYNYQTAFYRFVLPDVSVCQAWALETQSYVLSESSPTGVLMQIYTLAEGDSFSFPQNPWWVQWGTSRQRPDSGLLVSRSPTEVDSENAYWLQIERPEAREFIIGIRTYVNHTHEIASVHLIWYGPVDALNPHPVITPNTFSLGRAYPNPFNGNVTIPLTVNQTGRLNVEVYNLLGQKVATLIDGQAVSGFKQIRWQPENLGSGTYIIRACSQGSVANQRIVYLR